MAVTKHVANSVPDDQRLLLTRRVTGGGGADNAPTPALSVANYALTKDLLGIRLLIVADDATGIGEVADVVVWRYRRDVSEDPLGGASDPVWSQGETISGVKLGYEDALANKEFSIDTLGAERVFFQFLSVPVGVAWIRSEVYTNIQREYAIAAIVAGASTTSGSAAAYDPATGSLKVTETDPSFDHNAEGTLADVTNGTDGTYYYYVDMDSYRKGGYQFIFNGGSGTVTATFEGTMQDDGTAQAACAYEDITLETWAVATFTANDILSDDAEMLALYKYVRVVIVAATGAAHDADWEIFHKRLY